MTTSKETVHISLLLTTLFVAVSFTVYAFMKDCTITTQEVGFKYKIELTPKITENKNFKNDDSLEKKEEAGTSYSRLSHSI